jgi:NAD(P)-dependent dehydrogenase (short-subunit alcohol dehydrogenase family)
MHLPSGVAFISGGARGLGNAVAVSFAKAGCRAIVLVDIQDKEVMAEAAKNVESHGAEVRGIISQQSTVQWVMLRATSASRYKRM